MPPSCSSTSPRPGSIPRAGPTCGRPSHLVEDGTTIFLTTQYLEEADHLADEIAILHGGRVVARGTPDELKATVPAGRVELDFGSDADLTAAERALGEAHETTRVEDKLLVATTGSVADIA